MIKTTIFHAAWVLPITTPPVTDGAVVEQNGRVLAFGHGTDLRARFPDAREIDLGLSILLPGLTNAHTHLSLTNLSPTQSGTRGFSHWLKEVAVTAANLTDQEVSDGVDRGIAESLRLGTTLIGEITTRPEGVTRLLESQLAARVFFEFLGVTESLARERFEAATRTASKIDTAYASVRGGLSPHAPYSVWPDLWRETAAFVKRHDLRWSSHLAESAEERRFLKDGSGPILETMQSLGVWDASFPIPGCGAVEFLDREGVLDHRSLLVHGVDLHPEEIKQIETTGASLCLCPRSNAHLDLPPPPLKELLTSTIPLCLGTDSKASNLDLGIWGEMRALRKLDPDLPADRILEMATHTGAVALGMEDQGGCIQPGIPARLVAVSLNGGRVQDPCEFLVREAVETQVSPLIQRTAETEVG